MDPAFQYKKMRTLVPLFARCTRKLIDKWTNQSSGPIRVEEGLTELTLDAIGINFISLSSLSLLVVSSCANGKVIGLGAFGYDFGAVEGTKEMGENLEHYHAIIASMFRPLAFIFPIVTKLPTAYNRMLDERIKKFQAFLAHMIAAHRAGKTDSKDLDLLDHIIAMDDEGQLSNEEVHLSFPTVAQCAIKIFLFTESAFSSI